MLDAWKRSLSQSFEPIPITGSYSTPKSNSDTTPLAPVWIHPPAHAAAIQMYHFSRIVMVLNQPSTGGLNVPNALQDAARKYKHDMWNCRCTAVTEFT